MSISEYSRRRGMAHLLTHNVESVRANHLRPLLRDGRIAMTRPDKSNDPDQAYRTVDITWVEKSIDQPVTVAGFK